MLSCAQSFSQWLRTEGLDERSDERRGDMKIMRMDRKIRRKEGWMVALRMRYDSCSARIRDTSMMWVGH